MFNVDDYYFHLMVKHHDENMRRQMEQKQLRRVAKAARQPAAARLGDWMVKTGTALKQRYGSITDASPVIQPKHNTVRFKLS
jgi:hypothetical protein